MTDTVACLTIQDLPRFLPYIRKLSWRFARGISIERDDFVQDVCLRAVQFPPHDCGNDDVYRIWLFAIARTVGAEQFKYDACFKRAGSTYSLDQALEASLPPISGGQYEHTLLGELSRNGRSRLRMPKTRGRAIDDLWALLWRVAAGSSYNQRYRGRVFFARKALREEFAL